MAIRVGIEAAPLALQIQSAARRGDIHIPPLPDVVIRVQDLLRDENRADARRVATLVTSDAALASSIMRIANSATFGGLGTVSTLDEGIVRIGLRQVGSLVTTAGHKGHFQSADPARDRRLRVLWDHAVATALGARRLARMGGGDPDEAYLAGLLHDAGKLLALRGVDWLEHRTRTRVAPGTVDEILAITHEEMGFRMLEAWRVPAPAREAARDHHAAPSASDGPTLIWVRAANVMTRKLGAHPEANPGLDLTRAPEIERLGLEAANVEAWVDAVRGDLEEVRGLL